MENIALLFTGYSIFYAVSLSLTHFYSENYTEQRLAQVMGIILISVLASLQLSHFLFLLDSGHLGNGSSFIHTPYYVALLLLVAPTFYLFSKPLLTANSDFNPLQLLHFTPVMLAFLLPHNMAMQVAFGLGGLYLSWLGIRLYVLRQQRLHFRIELLMLGLAFVIAVLALILGLILPIISEKLFFTLYACAIGLAFLMINLVLSYAPQLSNDVVEAAREAYATSTLSNIDCDKSLQDLQQLMQQKKLYQENTVDLYTVASELGLTNHQLSELINTRLGKSFSRLMREYRVEAAKILLTTTPSSSVLSVGLNVGFTSQSNFYEAFREIVGTTPGKYRKLNKQS